MNLLQPTQFKSCHSLNSLCAIKFVVYCLLSHLICLLCLEKNKIASPWQWILKLVSIWYCVCMVWTEAKGKGVTTFWASKQIMNSFISEQVWFRLTDWLACGYLIFDWNRSIAFRPFKCIHFHTTTFKYNRNRLNLEYIRYTDTQCHQSFYQQLIFLDVSARVCSERIHSQLTMGMSFS